MAMHRAHRNGSVLRLLLAASVVATIFVSGMAMSLPRSASSAAALVEPATIAEIKVELHKAGFSAEALAAAGLGQQQVTSLVTDVKTHVQANIQALRDAEVTWGEARGEVDRLERRIVSGLSTPEERLAYTAAQTQLTTASTQRTTLRTGVYAAGAQHLSAGQLQFIQQFNANRAWDMPIQYRASSRAEPDWVNLRDALANARIAERAGGAPSATAQQIILQAQAEPAVSEAMTNLEQLAVIEAAWLQAVGG